MADAAAQDAAAKERIIKHMNADHADSIRRYLEAFRGKAFYQVRDAQITDITLNHMKLSCGSEQITFAFDPPMKSFREARERLVQLDKDALQTLGRSDITVTKFIPTYTNLFHLGIFTSVILTYVVFASPANFKPGSWFHALVFRHFPAFSNFAIAIQPHLIAGMLLIHVWEAYTMSMKLIKHGRTPYDRIWWYWVGTCFIEGFPSFQRLNGHLEERRKEKEAKKH